MATRLNHQARRAWASLSAWDFWLASAVALVSFLIMVSSERELERTGVYSGAAWTSGIALVGVSTVALRWVSDRLRESAYGELVRAADPSETEVAFPYWVVICAGVSLGVLGLVGALVDGELERPLLVLYWTSFIFTAIYAILAMISILRLTVWHQRQHALMQSQTEQISRELRRRIENTED